MKKAKIMLMTIAVIAAVGTGLAFKVQKFAKTSFCYRVTTDQPGSGECTSVATNHTVQQWNTGDTKLFYVITTDAGACSQASCTEFGKSPLIQ